MKNNRTLDVPRSSVRRKIVAECRIKFGYSNNESMPCFVNGCGIEK